MRLVKHHILPLVLGACLLTSCSADAPLRLATAEGEATFDLFVRLQHEFPPTRDSLTVIFDHSLAHEGLHEQGARALLSYRENMPRLIDTLQQRGYRVVLVPNRPADNFNETDMADMEEVNREMQHWTHTE
ncbi:MAG: hypothetical protein ACI4BD_01330 [Paludibacteraceae bacterium]